MTTNWHPCFDDLSREESEQHDWVYGENREEAGLGYQVNDVLLIPAWGPNLPQWPPCGLLNSFKYLRSQHCIPHSANSLLNPATIGSEFF